MMITGTREKATSPDDLARLFTERLNAGDAEGMAELYEDGAVLAVPPGGVIATGRGTIRAVFERILKAEHPREHIEPEEPEEPMPPLRFEDLALTTTHTGGGRAHVARRQPDGTWLRILDCPESGS